ncbi:neuronatin isoform X2 [Trichechus manatus latirostris]|uniref:Neuronatin n=3 Tax=Eutheria TaxID=9347 RepID=A0A2Y9D9E5_TRIMA|nr:neuronatin isoform X2 [Trichechus manatus latirostris]
MEFGRRGSVWKEQMDYFFLSWRMRKAPDHPFSCAPPNKAHAHLGGGWILKTPLQRLRQCAEQRTLRDQWTSANQRPALDHLSTTLRTMAAVAAASAELLIIGWYIFRVLLQVFLECCIYWVGFAFRNPPGTQPIARSEVFRYSLQKLAYTVSRTGRQVLGERRRAPN